MKKLVTLLMTATVAVSAVTSPVVVLAENIDSKIENAQQKINQLSSQLSQAETALNAITAEVEQAEKEAAALQESIANTQDKLVGLNDDIANLQELIEKRTEKLKSQARAEQTENNIENYLGVILSSESIVEAYERLGAIVELVSAGAEIREQQVKDKQAVEDKKAEVETSLVQLGEDASRLSEVQNALSLKKLEREATVQQVAIEKAGAEADKSQLIAAKEEAERRLAEARQAEAARVKAEKEAAAELKAAAVARQQSTVAKPTYKENQATVATTKPVTTKVEEVAKPVTTTTQAETTAPATQTVAKTETPIAPAASGKNATIYNAAMAQLGRIQDCTMLVTNSLRAAGINFHDWPAGYLSLGTVVPASQAQPGDIIYYANGGMGLAHVAVYIGNGQAVHGGFNGNQTVVATAFLGSGPVFIRVR